MFSVESSVAVNPGDILADRYRVDRVLGSGGMGVVVLAEHIELRERVAIKFLLDAAAEHSELSERFLREARAAVKIRSEHVVRVSDVGRLPSGAPYLVMEYLEGEDLSQKLERDGRVAIEEAVDYVIQCCEAMHVAHRAGIVHRDLKPANLFLTQRPDGSPIIKVLDFGISKVNGAEAGQMSLTRTQAMMGSPLYMSPEQMRSSKDVSASTDIWSLGVILHELIAGDVPFTGSSVTEVLVKVMQDEPPRLRTLRPEVPEALEAVVLRCLAKPPAARFSSVAALAVALTPFASVQTLGLQRRLGASRSERAPGAAPAGAPLDPRLAPTRIEVATPASAPASALPQGTLPSASSTRGEPVPAETNIGWEGRPLEPLQRAPRVPRWAWMGGAVAGVALLGLAGLVASGGQSRALPRSNPAPAAPSPAVVAPAPAAAAAPAPEPERAEPAFAPDRSASAPAETAPELAPAEPSEAATETVTRVPSRKAVSGARTRRPARRRAPPESKPAPDPPEPVPAPPARPSAAPAPRSKPLSIEFK